MRLSYLTFVARDVERLAQFYIDAFGLEEVTSSRDARYREVRGGGAMIGFAHQAAYATLGMPEDADPTGIRSMPSFALDRPSAVAPAVERAVRCGATLVKGPFDTAFGQHLAVVRDPEGNIVRLMAPSAA